MMPNSVVHASLDLDREPVPAEQSVQGEVTSGAATVDEFGGLGQGDR